jgi:hypothetical protein
MFPEWNSLLLRGSVKKSGQRDEMTTVKWFSQIQVYRQVDNYLNSWKNLRKYGMISILLKDRLDYDYQGEDDFFDGGVTVPGVSRRVSSTHPSHKC